jgi:ABC-2 type transport system permease protein
MSRSLRAPLVLLRASILSSLQYRGDFFFEAVRALFEVAWTLVPLLVIFGQRPTIAGWHVDEALLVTAWFTALKALLEGLITPSLVQTVEQIRRGTFDFVLLKPVDAQLLASFAKVGLFSAIDLVAAIGLVGVALHRLHHVPGAGELAVTLVLTLAAAAILYSLNLAALSVAFYVARIDNLAYLLAALFDAARWPSTVFRGAARLFFTFVLPLGLMTTFPPLALLGRLSLPAALAATGFGVLAVVASRALWLSGLRAYRSAGG